LVEYLDNAAKEIEVMKQKVKHLREKYRETEDKDLLNEIANMYKIANIKKRGIWETIYENIEEFRFMKKHFPRLFEVYIEDEAIGKLIRKKEWLADFVERGKTEAQEKLGELKKGIMLLKEIKHESKNWETPFASKMFGDAWQYVEGRIEKKTTRDELLQIVDNEIEKLRKHGWGVILNEPFILKHLHRFFNGLKNAVNVESVVRRKMEQSKGQGTYWEYKAKQELNSAIMGRKRAERLCRHLLMANPKFLKNFKAQNMVWRDKDVAIFIKKFLDEISVPEINEKEWVKEMKKKLEG